MKTKYTSLKKIFLCIILAIVMFSFLLRRCSRPFSEDKNEAKITIVRDTIWQTKIDTFRVQTLTYKTVYVDRDNTSNISEQLPKTIDSTKLIEGEIYRDTLQNDDIDFFSYNLVEGNLLNSEISYKLRVPREITLTKTIEYPKTYRSGLFIFSEIGGNQTRFDNLSLGLQYNRKGK